MMPSDTKLLATVGARSTSENTQSLGDFASGPTEKHNLGAISVVLLDKRSRTLWASNNPDVDVVGGTCSVRDFYSPDVATEILRITGQSFMDGNTDAYVAVADLTEQKEKWRVTVMPVDSPRMPNTAGVAFCSMLPPNYFMITDDEKLVLKLLSEDFTLREIAAQMHRSQSAIDAKIKSLKTKLECRTIGGLVAKAVRTFVI